MRRQLMVKLNCLVILFVSVGCSYGLNPDHETVFRSNKLYPFSFTNTTSSRTTTSYNVKTQTSGRVTTTNSITSGSTGTTNLGSFEKLDIFVLYSMTVIVNPDGRKTIIYQRRHRTSIKRTCGKVKCNSAQQQSINKISMLTITKSDFNACRIIWKLKQFPELCNEKFDVCTCKSISDCSCNDKTTSYTFRNPCYCLCLEEQNDEHKCICSARIIDVQIKNEMTLKGCLCYNIGITGTHLECKCRNIQNDDTYDSYKYTSIEIEVRNTRRIENVREAITGKFSEKDRNYDSCYCPQFEKCDLRSPKYTHNGLSHCLCKADIAYLSTVNVRCTCNLYILQPKIKYDQGELHSCYCIFGPQSSICKCKNIVPEQVHIHAQIIYDYSKVLLEIRRELRIEDIISNLKQFREFQNEKFDVCTYNKGKWSLAYNTTTCTKENPCSCLCIRHAGTKCVCNSHILELRIKSDVNLTSCLCYRTDGAGSLLKCSCRKMENSTIYDSNKYTSLELEVKDARNTDNIRDAIKDKFSEKDRDYDFCYCTQFGKCDLRSPKYTRNGLSHCLCTADYISPEFPVRCICNLYILQPKIKYENGILQRCICIASIETICKCNPCISSASNLKPIRYNTEGIFDLIPFGKIGIEELRRYLQDRVEFRNEKLDTYSCNNYNEILKCNCDHPTTTYACKNFDAGFCLCLHPKLSMNRPNCLCNSNILKRQFRYSTDLYTLKGCICVHDNSTSTELTCRCRDIDPKLSFDRNKYLSTEVDLPTKSMNIMQLRDIIIPKLQYDDKKHVFCSFDEYSLKGRCNLYYPVNGVAPCLCVESRNSDINNCICNYYVLQLKLRYTPGINPPKNCYCVPEGTSHNVFCKCRSTFAKQPPAIRATRIAVPTNYNYENTLLTLPENVTLDVLHQEFLQTTEFKDEQFNICRLTVKQGNKNNFFCSQFTKSCTKEKPCNCLCIHSYVKDSMENCLCNEHISKPKISYSYFAYKNNLYDCSCYNSRVLENILACDNCTSRKPYNPDYRSVLLNITQEIDINIAILLQYFEKVEEYRLNRFHACVCSIPQEKLPCSCITNYYQKTKQYKTLNYLCIVYKPKLKKLPQCMFSHNVLLADITYNTNLIELQKCVCKISTNETIKPICDCKRKNSFNPNYNILLEFNNEDKSKDIIRAFKKQSVFRHEHFIQCTYSDHLNCLPTNNTELYIYKNLYYCLCINEWADKKDNKSNCLCSINVLKPQITYKEKFVRLQACTCGASDFKCHCEKKLSYNPYNILIEFQEVTIHTSVILRYLRERWEFQYEIFNQCTGAKNQSTLTLSCKRSTKLCTKDAKCKCLCLSHMPSEATECLCSPHVLRPNITYNAVVNTLEACRCYNKDHQLACNCRQKLSFEPKFDNILIVFQEVVINKKIIYKYIRKYWQYKHEIFTHCKGNHLNSPLRLNCVQNTQTCMKNKNCNCLCVFQSKRAECLCSSNILLPNITYNTDWNNLQECMCDQQRNKTKLKCKCTKKESFEPKYELILMKFEEVTIQISIILKYLEERWEFKHENFNSCNGTSLQLPLTLTCIKPTSMCQKNHCNCLCVFDESASETECLCSAHVLLPNITYITTLNNLQACKCYHNDNTKNHYLTCDCVKKSSFEPNYKQILIEWHQIRINISIIISYLQNKWEFQYDVYNVCTGTNLISPLILTCSEKTKECTRKNRCNCLCIFHQGTRKTECVCSSHVLLPNITYSTSLNDLQECTCHSFATDKRLSCNCSKKLSFEPRFDLILIDFQQVTIYISTIIQYLKEIWQFQHEVFNSCKTNELKSLLRLNCINEVKECTANNPCNCLCVLNHKKNDAECMCSPHVLLPNITYNTIENDLQKCECIYQRVTKDDGKHLMCKCDKQPSFEPRYDLILVEWLEVHIDINIMLTYFKQRWEFLHETFKLCKGTKSKTSITLACTENAQKCTEKNNCSCLCIFDHKSNEVECLCNRHVLVPSITYSSIRNDLQECTCVYKSDTKDLTCICKKKISFNPKYDILIKLDQEMIDITIILTYLKQRLAFYHEAFNICNGTSLDSRFTCTEKTVTCTKENICNCLCIVNQAIGAPECLCSRHVLLPNITYSTTLNNLQQCGCLQMGNSNQMTCTCVRKPSFELRYDLILIEFQTVTIDINIVLTYFHQKWEFKHDEFNHCKGTNLKSSLTLTCTEQTKNCTRKSHCNCLCVFHRNTSAVECLCSTHILLPNITYNTIENDLQGCTCYSKDKTDQMICNCTRKPSFEPKYKLILIELIQTKVHINTILQYLEQMWEFQYEVFNLCTGVGLNFPLTVNCTNKIYECTEKNQCNCLCVLDEATTTTECLCSPHVLLPNITYKTNVNNLQGCSCFHNQNTNQLICNCVKKPSFEPIYDLILMEFLTVKIQINIIVTYLQKRWEFQHEIFNLCHGNSSLQLTCTKNTKDCTEKDKCNCLCVFQTNAKECVCNAHVLLPNITYSTTLNNLQGCRCVNKGNTTNQISCNCTEKPSFEPKYDLILIEWDYIQIDITIIIKYLQKRWEFRYEVFNQCNGTILKENLTLICEQKTELCTEKNRCNCLCVFHQLKSTTECLCSTHILLPNITYTTTQNDLQGCTCINKGKTNQLLCKCVKKPSFEPRYDLILLGPYEHVEITIILTYLQKRWEFQHEVFNLCTGTSLLTPLILECTRNTQTCTKTNNCNCLCLFHHNTSASECLCSPHVHLPNITYVATMNDLQQCTCEYSGDTNYLICNCDKKPSFDPSYNILIEWDQEKIDITIILTYLQQRWEFQYDVFNICKGTSLKANLICTKSTHACTQTDQCNCLCIINQTPGSIECLCSAHVLLPNMTYNTDKNNIQDCRCFQKSSSNEMICNCAEKSPFAPRYYLRLIEVGEVKINIKIILTYFKKTWEFHHEVFNHCTGSNSKATGLKLTCDDKTQKCTDKNHCNCLCEFKSESTAVDCYCSAHVLLPNITYSATSIDLRDCTCINKNKPNQVSCDCVKKSSFEPKYDMILIELHEVTIHINLILQYLEERWEFQHEIFSRCAGTSVTSSLNVSCPNNTYICKEKKPCNCLCVFDHATSTTECLCSPHVLLPNITYNAVQNDLRGCLCFYKDNKNLLTCNCEMKPSFEPKYDILIVWKEEYKNITILLSYLKKRWEFQHEVFNLCKSSSLDSSLTLKCTDKPDLCTEENQCNCLCVSNYVTNTSECLCSPHVFLPNITYNADQMELRECVCVYKSNTNQLSCNCERKPTFDPGYDILIVWKEVHFNIQIFLTYLKEMWQFQHEVFNVCNSSSLSLETSFIISCTGETQECTENNYCNCLCALNQVSKSTECLCSNHITLLDVTYNTTLLDIRECECVHKNNQLSCKCKKKPSFEPRYDILIDWQELQIDITVILTYFEEIWEFRHEIFNLCTGTSLIPTLTLNCTENTQICTDKDNCNCLCLFDHVTGVTDCLCGAHVLLPNITYSSTYDIQGCKCINKVGTDELTCKCNKKPSFDPSYGILIEAGSGKQEVIDIIYILTYLQQRWEFQYEVFNLCNGTDLILSCIEETSAYTVNNKCNCLCVFHNATNARECLCSNHVLLPNITYDMSQNNLEDCSCYQKGNLNQMTCNCVNKLSFETKFNLILIKFQEVTIDVKIILTYFKNRWEFQHDVFNQCKGITSNSSLALTCTAQTQHCTKKQQCDCLCVFAQEVECLCSSHILLPNVTYSTTQNNLQGCICLHKGNTNQMSCDCKEKPSFEPNYDHLLIELGQVTVHINIILQYLEQRWEFQYETFNLCTGNGLKLPLTITCINLTQECTEKNLCNCLCLFDHATDTTDCICNSHVLSPNITYTTTQYDLRGCTCFSKINTNQLICKCEKKPSYEPRYDILIQWQEIKIDITIILTYMRKRWEFQHEVFNLCKGNTLKSPATLTCNDTTDACTDENQCFCLCVFYQETSMIECVCSAHILLPNIRYSNTMNDLQECNCTNDGNANQLTCKCGTKLSFNPRYDILIDFYEIKIDISIILTYLQQKWKYESFIQCNGTQLSLITCEEKTEIYVGENHCNCLCVYHKINNNNEVKCLCSPHVLLPKIKYIATKNDLQGCKCNHTGKTNQLSCKCAKIPSFEPNYGLVLIKLFQVRIDISIIRTYLLEKWEFQYENFNECSGVNLNSPLILTCAQITEAYTGNNSCNCLCTFYHATSTSACLCSPHVSLVTFTYNTTTNDIQECSCQYEGGSYQLTCNCKKKESFEPRYDLILFDAQKATLTVQFIQKYFKSKQEFRFETFNQIRCNNSKLPLSCTWTDKEAISTEEVSYNCLCILSAFSSRAANCSCSEHILIPDIKYNTNLNKLQSCKCHNTLQKLEQLSCKCTTKESFNPNYGDVEVNLGSIDFLKIILIEEFLKTSREFRHEVFNRCSCYKKGRILSCNCQNDAKSYTAQIPDNCVCTWLSDESITAECLCNNHILDVKYKFTSLHLKLGNCSSHNTGNDIRSLVVECDEMASVDKRYANFIVHVPSKYNEIKNLAKFISTNFTTRDKFFETCTNQDYRACLYNVTNNKKPLPCLCLTSKSEHNNGCAYSLYIVQPMILYDDSKYKLYRCYFGTQWVCELVNGTLLEGQQHAHHSNIHVEIRYNMTVQNVTRHVNNTKFLSGPQVENHIIIRNVTRNITYTNYTSADNLNMRNYTTGHRFIKVVINPNVTVQEVSRTVRVKQSKK